MKSLQFSHHLIPHLNKWYDLLMPPSPASSKGAMTLQWLTVCVHTILPQGETHEKPWKPNFSFIYYGGVLKWWFPTTLGFPTKDDHFEVFWGTTIQGNIPIITRIEFLKIKSMRRLRSKLPARNGVCFARFFNGLIGHQQISGLFLGFLCLP